MSNPILEEWFNSMPKSYATCRDVRHAWDHTDEYWNAGPARQHPMALGMAVRELACIRCGAKKYQILNKTSGKIMAVKYKYPDGYRKPKSTVRVGPANFRQLLLQQKPTKQAPSEEVSGMIERLKKGLL